MCIRDSYYAKHISFALDMKILLKTARGVVKGDGVVEGGTHGVEAAKRGARGHSTDRRKQ